MNMFIPMAPREDSAKETTAETKQKMRIEKVADERYRVTKLNLKKEMN